MASGKSRALKNEILDCILGGEECKPARRVYIALYTTSPTLDGKGTEVSGRGYERVAIDNNLHNFPPAKDGHKSNGVTLTFPQAKEDWGTVKAIGIHSDPTRDSLLFFGDLLGKQRIKEGSVVDLPAHSITVIED